MAKDLCDESLYATDRRLCKKKLIFGMLHWQFKHLWNLGGFVACKETFQGKVKLSSHSFGSITILRMDFQRQQQQHIGHWFLLTMKIKYLMVVPAFEKPFHSRGILVFLFVVVVLFHCLLFCFVCFFLKPEQYCWKH